MAAFLGNRGSTWLWVVPLALGLVACSGSAEDADVVGGAGAAGTDSGGTGVPEGREPGEVSLEPGVGCLALTSDRSGLVSGARWTHDPGMRLLSSLPSDENGALTDSTDPATSRVLHWRLDAESRVSLRAGGGSGYRPWRQTWERDERGNVLGLHAVYLDQIDLSGTSTGQSYSDSEYTNEYDAVGRLLRHATLGQNDGAAVNNTFVHDAQGRCEVIADADGAELERRDYDAAGRLSHRYLATTQPRAELGDGVPSVVTYAYDELGRLRSAEQVIEGETAAHAQLTLDYRADGTLVEEQMQLSDDGDGFYRRVWAPECSNVLQLIVRMRPDACVADYGSAGDFHIP
jgi:hypothetical protein